MCLRFCKCIGTAIISALLGVAVGILFFFSLITALTPAVIIALIFSVVSLLLLTITETSAVRKARECVCKFGKCILIGAIITIILGTVASVLTLIAGSVGFAVLIGLGASAFFFTLFSVAELIGCMIECKYECED